jgi:hypothetical protein
MRNDLNNLISSQSFPTSSKTADVVNGNYVNGQNNIIKSSSISQNVVTNNNNVFIPSDSSSSQGSSFLSDQ